MMTSGRGCSHANTMTETLTVVPQMPHQLWRIFNAGVQDDHGRVLQSQVLQGRPPVSGLRGIGDHSQRTCKICRPPTRCKTSSLGSSQVSTKTSTYHRHYVGIIMRRMQLRTIYRLRTDYANTNLVNYKFSLAKCQWHAAFSYDLRTSKQNDKRMAMAGDCYV